MSRLLPLASAIALAVSLSAASSQETRTVSRDQQIIGEWQGDVNSNGATARMTLILFRDGTYVKRIVFVNEYGWTAEGNTLLIAPSVRYGDSLLFAKAMSMQIRVSDSSLITKSGKDSLKLHRYTYKVDQSPLLGRWQGQTDFGEELTEDFTADGRLIVSITLTHEAGRYSINKDVIEWWQQIPTPNKRREKFAIDGNKLKVYLVGKIPPIELTRTNDQVVAN
jgi:hypothetical protein